MEHFVKWCARDEDGPRWSSRQLVPVMLAVILDGCVQTARSVSRDIVTAWHLDEPLAKGRSLNFVRTFEKNAGENA